MPKGFDQTYLLTEDGLSADTRRFLSEYLKLFVGGKVRIRINRPKRSSHANSYMWGVVYKTIGDAYREAGYSVTDNDLHKHFKKEYLSPIPSVTLGEAVVIREPSTANLDSTQFFDYVEKIRFDEKMVLSIGIHIPEPDKKYRSYGIAEP